MKNTTVANAQDGIKITHENLSRFNKRLHKAMKEDGLDVSYTLASNLLAKAFGKRNTHELLEVLSPSAVCSAPQENQYSNGYSTRTEDMTKTYFDCDGNQVEILIKVFFAVLNKDSLIDFCGRVSFVKSVGSLPGSFKFKIEQMLNSTVVVSDVIFENFKTDSKKEFFKEFERFFESESEETKKRLERDLMILWGVREGEYYQVYSSKEFHNLVKIKNFGYFKESYLALSKDEYKKLISNSSQDGDLFSLLEVNGEFKGFCLNKINLGKYNVYDTLEEPLAAISGDNDSGVIIPILVPYKKGSSDKSEIYSYMILTKERGDLRNLKVSAIYNRVFDMNTIEGFKSIKDLLAFTKGYIFKNSWVYPVNIERCYFYKRGETFVK